MPQLIDHIDAIARKNRRAVLYLEFHPKNYFDFDEKGNRPDYNWNQDSVREEILQHLNDINITWTLCGHFANENMLCCYLGQVYIDVPFDEANKQFQSLQAYLERPDGSMRFPTVRFYYLPLEEAMKNAHHDEPGFWERWAETF